MSRALWLSLPRAGSRKPTTLFASAAPLPAVCGRLCAHPCQDACNRNEIDEALSIRDLERFVADHVYSNPADLCCLDGSASPASARIAVIGSGAAGLTASADLAMKGYRSDFIRCQAAARRNAPLRHPGLQAAQACS